MRLKIIIPVIILLCAMGIAWALIITQPEPARPVPPESVPAVDVISAKSQTITLNVHAQGIITPRTEIDLVPEIAGRITRLHPAFVTGETFNKGDVLIAIDPRDYDLAITNAEAQVAQARHRLALEEAESVQARHEWETLGGRHPPTPLMLRKPQLAEAHAKLKAAQASLAQARLKRSRCDWRTPFSGKIRSKTIGLGQYVQPGSALARIYATDTAEVRLPLTMDQLNYIVWPQHPDAGENTPTGHENRPRVSLTAQIAGTQQLWRGHIIRIDSGVDETTGLVYAVAEIHYPQHHNDNQHQLLPGLFVTAEIEGRRFEHVFKLPREAVTANRQVLLIDQDERIRKQSVSILRIETDHMLINGGLNDGDLIAKSAMTAFSDGIKVKPNLIQSETASQTGDTFTPLHTARP